MDMLVVEHVAKKFGTQQIIKDLSFRVPEHTIYGFIGQNGAGKTTTMKMILGLLPMDSGNICVNETKVTFGQNQTNQFIGYLPDVPEYYNFMTPVEYLNLCGEITGMKKEDRKQQIRKLLDMVGLAKAEKRIQGFSRGMKQRLGIAQALLNQPKLLICDEPTSALDPVGRKELLDILTNVKEQTTVIFSTHILSDVERICDEIGLLHNGTLALQKTMAQIHKENSNNGLITEFRTSKDANHFLSVYPGGSMVGHCQILYEDPKLADMNRVMQTMVHEGIQPLKIEMCEPTLESLFMEVTAK